MKLDKKLRKQLDVIEKRFSVNPAVLAKANRLTPGQGLSPSELCQDSIDSKRKSHKIAERSILFALDQVELEYLTKQKRIILASEKAIDSIRYRQGELQKALDQTKESGLNTIQPDIQCFLKQSKLLKKIAKNGSPKRSPKFMDAERITDKIKELKKTIEQFEKQINIFCTKTSQAAEQIKSLNLHCQGRENPNIKEVQVQTLEEILKTPEEDKSFDRKLKQIRGIFMESMKAEGLSQAVSETFDLTKQISRCKEQARIEVNQFANVSIGHIFDSGQEGAFRELQCKFKWKGCEQKIERRLVSYPSDKDIEYELDRQLDKYQRMRSEPKLYVNKLDGKRGPILTLNLEQDNRSLESISKCTLESDLKSLTHVKSEQNMPANKSRLSQKSHSSRGRNCLEILRMQKQRYDQIRNGFVS